MNFIVKTVSVNNEKDYCKNKLDKEADCLLNGNLSYNQKLYLVAFISKLFNQKDNILVRNCTTAENHSLSLAIQLSDTGFRNVTNVNTKEAVVHFESQSFDCFLDEGIAVEEDELLYKEINRIIKVGGRYVFISPLPRHIILNGYIAYFHNLGWNVQICRTIELNDGSCISFPLFVIVCTKIENGGSSLLKFCPCDTEREQLFNLEDLVDRVESLHNLALINHQIRNLGDGHHLSEEISMDLFDLNSEIKTVKYRLYILDRGIESANKFAAFIVPQGRENCWIFKAKEGRIKFSNDAQFERLVLIHLGRDHSFENLDLVQKELTNLICSFQPKSLPPNAKIPFMSLSDQISQRKEIYRGVSEISGEYAIVEVEDEEEDGTIVTLRSLIFLSDASLIQTEAKLNNHGEVDLEYLTSSYQVTMVDELEHHFLNYHSTLLDINVLVIGLGGGTLCSYLHAKFPELHTEAVEIDPTVVEIAKRYFGLITGPNLKVNCADGLAYIRDLAYSDTRFGCIIIDVDCKDKTVGLCSPTTSFVEKSFISCLKTCLKPSGLLLINFYVRDDEFLREELIRNFRESFSHVEVKKSKEAFNEIVVCFANGSI